jgi:predicted amidohydrolase YtcJ
MSQRTIFVNGRFHTCDPATEGARAVAVDDGRIIDAGADIEIRSLAGKGYEINDLNGKCVVPGFIDAHLHLLSLGQSFKRVNLDGLDSLDKIKSALRTAASGLSDKGWLRGRGWNKNLWGEEFPTKTVLDEITENPVALSSKDGHLIWVNSTALNLLGIDESTPDPAGGVIVKDNSGRPTGILKENAVDLVLDNIPAPSYGDDIAAIETAQKHLLSLGITGVGDCDEKADLFAMYNDLDQERRLHLRVFKMIPRRELRSAIDFEFKTGSGSEHLRVGCLKLFADGALGSQTALMFKPYCHSSDNYGVQTLSGEEIEEYVEQALAAAISIAVHAIGDRANYQTLNAIGRYHRQLKLKGLRPRIEHAQLLRACDIDLFKNYDIIASVQPIHATSDRDVADKYWGERCRYAYPFKTFLDRGIKLAFGSDAPIETASPVAGIHAAVTRQRAGENRPAWFPEERITVAQALKAYTSGSAHACCLDDLCGSISIGKRADMVVLSEDIFEIEPRQIATTEILKTIVDGKVVYPYSA